jgi:hypothetical protein
METQYQKDCSQGLAHYIRIYSVFKSGSLRTKIKLTFYRVLIRSAMTYACPPWEYATGPHLLNLQGLDKRVLRAI